MKNKVVNLFEPNTIVQNEGVKYSTLLEKFMTPFSNDFSNFEFQEDIIEFAINAWNYGNMSSLATNEDFKEIMNSTSQDEINMTLLKKMITSKVTNFKEFTHFIVDFEIKQTANEFILKVITQRETDYLSNMADEDTPFTENDFDENYINRSAILLKPQQPLFDWLNTLYPKDNQEDTVESNIYLIDDGIDDVDVFLKKKYDKFFKMELNDWHTNKKEWPQKRNYKMFKQWFNIEFSTMVYDLEKEPVLKLDD